MRQLLCVAVLLGSGQAIAGVDPKIVDSIHKVKPADYPSANTIAVVADQQVVYQTTGEFTNTTHLTTLVMTQAGIKDAATQALPYAKGAETLEIVSAQVIKADGTVVPVPAKDIQDTEQSGTMNIYDPNGRAKKVSFTSLAVGDATDIVTKLTRSLPTRENHFNDVFGFQSGEPMLSATYSVDGPAALPLTSQIYHGERGAKIAASKSTVGDRVHYAWHVDRAPQVVPEPGMNASNEIPMLVVTTDPSWNHFSSWWANLTEKQMEVTPELAKKVDDLTKGKTTDADKIKALYDFVSTEIRYRGLGVGPRTGYTPRKAQETLTSRWGVCRDVSILLTTMLRKAGFEAYPVLTNVGDPVLPKVAYDGFNHAIVAMPNKSSPGTWTYLDPTAKNMNEMLPGEEAEQSTLVSTKSGEPLTTTPAVDPKRNLGHVTATTVVAGDGSMTSKVTFEMLGVFDTQVRQMIAMSSQSQQREALEGIIRAALPEAKLVSLTTTPPLDLKVPIKVTVEIKVPNAAATVGEYRLLRTLVTSGALGLAENLLPKAFGGLQKRQFGLDASTTLRYDQDETVTLPVSTKIVALPNDTTSDNKVSSVVASCKKTTATTLDCHRSFTLKTRYINPSGYVELMGSLSQMGRAARQPVVLAGGKS